MSTIAASAKRMVVLIIVAGAVACAHIPNGDSTGTNATWHGNLTNGNNFGAAIGQAAYDARQEMLAAGYGFEGEFVCPSRERILPDCPTEARYLRFQPTQIGEKGHIYLQVENGVVSRIVWELSPVAYVDD